jgi:hypothetical protein
MGNIFKFSNWSNENVKTSACCLMWDPSSSVPTFVRKTKSACAKTWITASLNKMNDIRTK